MRQRFEPELLAVLREGYGGKALARDLISGLVVAIVALPLAIAFAIASGVTPDRGIITAIVAGFLISLLGGSRVQIGGPTGAYVAIVFAVVAQHGVDGLILATLMAGLILVLLGALGLGTIIRHVPYPITIGFTAGIALIIGMGQVREALGLQVGAAEGHSCRVLSRTSAPWTPSIPTHWQSRWPARSSSSIGHVSRDMFRAVSSH